MSHTDTVTVDLLILKCHRNLYAQSELSTIFYLKLQGWAAHVHGQWHCNINKVQGICFTITC